MKQFSLKQFLWQPVRLSFVIVLLSLVLAVESQAQGGPEVNDIYFENFEGGFPSDWVINGNSNTISVETGVGRNGSRGLQVQVSNQDTSAYNANVAQTEEGYLTFWYRPNTLSVADTADFSPPRKAIRVAGVQGQENWQYLVALRVRTPTEGGVLGFLEWQNANGLQFDHDLGEFELSPGWQKITLGYKANEWVAVWVNDTLVRRLRDVTHSEQKGAHIRFGRGFPGNSLAASGTMYFDNVAFQVPSIRELWVSSNFGDDTNEGTAPSQAMKTIQRAAELAGPGTTINILPGFYRESIIPAVSGNADDPIRFLGRPDMGVGEVQIAGSTASAMMLWQRLESNTIGLPSGVDPSYIFYTDISSWNLEAPPRFIVQLNNQNEPNRFLPMAHEPDWHVETEWKQHEFWWAADGGAVMSPCNPVTDDDPIDCDFDSRSDIYLLDRTNDSQPTGIEAGNLTTLGDLTGATIHAIDTVQGHYRYQRKIIDHNVSSGRITVDDPVFHDTPANPGFGWGTKYYVEGKANMLDTEGEWWFDESTGRLYVWPPDNTNPAFLNLEISQEDYGFNLTDRSYIHLEKVSLAFYNKSAVYINNNPAQHAYGNAVRDSTIRYANRGLYLQQGINHDEPDNIVDGFTLENSEIGYMDTHAIYSNYYWANGSDPASFTHVGVKNVDILHNELHHLGYRSDSGNAVGAHFHFATDTRLIGNHVHHVAHNGIQFSWSIIDANNNQSYGFNANQIKTGNILVQDNIFEHACQLTTDCGGLKFWGSPPERHVYRDVLLVGNTFRNNIGWTYVSEQRNRWSPNTTDVESEIKGMGGFGLYVDVASGIHAYRNVAHNNGWAGYRFAGHWRDGEMVFYNNVAANNVFGFRLAGRIFDTHGHVDTQLVNNLIINNEQQGILIGTTQADYRNLSIDHNLYDNNGWREADDFSGAMAVYETGEANEFYRSLADIQSQTAWEQNGRSGPPSLVDFDSNDHRLVDSEGLNFEVTSMSTTTLDAGQLNLPNSMTDLLQQHNLLRSYCGSTWDIGAFEAGYALRVTPSMQNIDFGESANYSINMDACQVAFPSLVSVSAPISTVTTALNTTTLTVDRGITLTVNETSGGNGVRGWLTLPITSTAGAYTETTWVRLLIAGQEVYLPILTKNYTRPEQQP